MQEIESNCRIVDSKIVTIIFNCLVQKFYQGDGYKDRYVNFEDLVNVIEELILYYSDPSELKRDYIRSIFNLSAELESDFSKFYKGQGPSEFWKKILIEVLMSISLRIHHTTIPQILKFSQIISKNFGTVNLE